MSNDLLVKNYIYQSKWLCWNQLVQNHPLLKLKEVKIMNFFEFFQSKGSWFLVMFNKGFQNMKIIFLGTKFKKNLSQGVYSTIYVNLFGWNLWGDELQGTLWKGHFKKVQMSLPNSCCNTFPIASPITSISWCCIFWWIFIMIFLMWEQVQLGGTIRNNFNNCFRNHQENYLFITHYVFINSLFSHWLKLMDHGCLHTINVSYFLLETLFPSSRAF
jgi:hypothetical protein